MPYNSGMVEVQSTDVIVVGAGPIGIESAVALKKAGIEYLHFDARQIGYTVSWFAPQTRFFSSNERIAIAGVPLFTADQAKSTREEYLAYLRGVVQQFDLRIQTYEPVVGIEKKGETFLVRTRPAAGPAMYRAKRVILATGGTERPRRLGIVGEDLSHVSHYFRDPHEYFHKRLLVVGGRNSAIEAMLRSHHAGAEVSMSYRREKLDAASIKYWLWPEMNGLIQADKIHAHFETTPVEITPASVKLARADGSTFDCPADFVLLLIGYGADMSLFKMAGVTLLGTGQVPKYDPATMQTDVPGIYLAGTAMGGTQEHYQVFLENCHVHVERIVASLLGKEPPAERMEKFEGPES
jgi:thioredoxin reductase (NADPH)